MNGGAISLYGFTYQIYLSLVALLHGRIDHLRVISSDLKINPSSLLPEGKFNILVALEGKSDVDIYSDDKYAQYIQVKSSPKDKSDWTINDLFIEVLQKLPLSLVSSKETRLLSYILITDKHINEAVEQFLIVCRWLQQKPSTISWDSYVTHNQDDVADRLIEFPKADIWGNSSLRCTVRALPKELHRLMTFTRKSKSPKATTTSQQSFTFEQVCHILAAFNIVTDVAIEELQRQVQEQIRLYVPAEKVINIENALFRYAIRLAVEFSEKAVSRLDFLEGIGIMQQPFLFEPMRVATQSLALKRIASAQNAPPHAAVRADADSAVEQFLLSDKKVFVLTGQANVGKSRQFREWAKRLSNEYIVYFDLAKRFDMSIAASEICSELGHESNDAHLALPSLIKRSQEGIENGKIPKSLLIFIDAIDEASDLTSLENRLRRLLESAYELPVKIFISCKSAMWEHRQDVLHNFPLIIWHPTGTEGDIKRIQPSFELCTFTDSERDEALRENRCHSELVNLDPVLQDMLHDPGYFTIYREVQQEVQQGVSLKASHLTYYPVRLFKNYRSLQLVKWSRQSEKRTQLLESAFSKIAECIYNEAKPDSTVSWRTVNEIIPSLDAISESASSPYFVARSMGLLTETAVPEAHDPQVAIQPPYLLEYEVALLFRKQLETLPADDQEALDKWFHNIVNQIQRAGFDPAIYALAFLIQELCLEEDGRASDLLKKVMTSHTFRMNVFIKLVSDAATPQLLDMVREEVYDARQALAALGSQRSVRAILELLKDSNESIRVQAAYALEKSSLTEEWVIRAIVEHSDEGWKVEHALQEAVEETINADLNKGSQKLLRALESYLVNSQPDTVRIRASNWTGAIAHKSSVAALRCVLPKSRHDNKKLWDSVIYALARMGDKETVLEPIKRQLNSSIDDNEQLDPYLIWSLGDTKDPSSLPFFEYVINNKSTQSHLAVEWSFRGIRLLRMPNKTTLFSGSALLAGDNQHSLDMLWEIGRAHDPEGVQVVLRCLVDAMKSQQPDNVWLHYLVMELDKIRTLGEIESMISLKESNYELWEAIEEVAFQLATNWMSHDARGRTRERDLQTAGKNLLTILGSPRRAEGFMHILSANNKDRFSRREVAEDMACVGNEDDLFALKQVEQETRGVEFTGGSVPEPVVLASEAAQAVATIGGKKAFGIYADFIKYHFLNKEAVDAIHNFDQADQDIEALLLIAEDAALDPTIRLHAVYGVGTESKLSQQLMERVFSLFINTSNPVTVRTWAAKALGWQSFRYAEEQLLETYNNSDTEKHLKIACEEALCRLGNEFIAKKLIKHISDSIKSKSSNDISESVWRLNCFPDNSALRTSIDKLMVEIISLPHYGQSRARYEAMRAVREQHRAGVIVPGVVEALTKWLFIPRIQSTTRMDDYLGPKLFAEIAPETLQNVVSKINFRDWSNIASTELIKALGNAKQVYSVEALVSNLSNENATQRRVAARSLSKLVQDNDELQNTIKSIASKGAKQLCYAAEALLWVTATWADSLLNELTLDDNYRVRCTAETIIRWRAESNEAAAIAERFCNVKSPSDRWAYAQVLERIGNEDTLDHLTYIMNTPEERHGNQHGLLALRCHEAIKKRLKDLNSDLEKKPVWRV